MLPSVCGSELYGSVLFLFYELLQIINLFIVLLFGVFFSEINVYTLFLNLHLS